MFSDPNLVSSKAGSGNSSIFPPSTQIPKTQEMRDGLTKAISAFGIIKTNCNTACLTALDFNEKKIDFKDNTKLESCVRRCFVQRLKEHFPSDNQIADFAYSSAFTYKQKDLFFLSLNNIGEKDSVETVKFNDIENVAKSFNNYFA